jgi:type I restriction enzyme, S subunit
VSWRTAPLGDLCDVRIGRTPSRNRREYWGPGAPWLSISDIKQGRDLYATSETITDQAVRECKMQLVEPGTVLLSFKLSIGKVGIVRTPMYTNEAIAQLPITDGNLLPEYLAWALSTTDLGRTDRAAMGATLNTEKLKRIPVPMPPLAEQRRIADILDKADNLRSERRRTLDLVDDLICSIFLDMFGDPETNPKGWPREELGKYADRITKGESPRWQGFGYQDSGALFVTSENVRLGQINLSNPKYISMDFHNKLLRSKLKEGDLLVNLVGASIGRSCLFTGWSGPANINQAVAVITLKSEFIDPSFLVNLFTVEGGQRLILSNRVEAARANISLSDLRVLPIPIPPIALQRKFVSRAACVANVRNGICSSFAQLNNLFASLQYRAFRGEQ